MATKASTHRLHTSKKQDALLEMIRSAVLKRLCIELTYLGSVRLVEPYSLRFTNRGNILLHCRRVDGDEVRTYRLDRIEQVRVTNIPFVPKYTVEMNKGGPLLVQPPSRY